MKIHKLISQNIDVDIKTEFLFVFYYNLLCASTGLHVNLLGSRLSFELQTKEQLNVTHENHL